MAPTDDRTQNARRFRVDVNMGTLAVPDWQQLMGIEEIKPTFAPRREGDESIEDDGAMRNVTTGYSWGLELKLIHRTAADGITWNAVQELLRTRAQAGTTAAGEVQIRVYDRNGLNGENFTGWCLVTWTPDGGGGAARDTVAVVLSGQGARADLVNPLANLTPIVASVTPSTGLATAGGEQIIITGTHFTGATAVAVGVTAVTDYAVVDSTRIAAITPAKAAGTYQVAVTTPAGTSADVAGDNVTYA